MSRQLFLTLFVLTFITFLSLGGIIHADKISPNLNLLLNGSSFNLSASSGSVINITATVNNVEGMIYIYNNTELLTSCNNSLTCENISVFVDSDGVFNITAHYPETENYSQETETWYIQLMLNTPPSILSTTEPDDPSIYIPENVWQFSATVCDAENNIDTVIFEWNNSNTSITTYDSIDERCRQYNTNKTDLGAGYYTWKWYVNDSYDLWTSTAVENWTLNMANPSIHLLIDNIEGNITRANYGIFNITGYTNLLNTQEMVFNLYNDTNLLDTGSLIQYLTNNLTVGEYFFVFNTTGNSNYTSASVAYYITIFNVTEYIKQNTAIDILLANKSYDVNFIAEINFNNPGSSVNSVSYNYTIPSEFLNPVVLGVFDSDGLNISYTVENNKVIFISQNVEGGSNLNQTVEWRCDSCVQDVETIQEYSPTVYNKTIKISSSLNNTKIKVQNLRSNIPPNYSAKLFDLRVYLNDNKLNNYTTILNGSDYYYIDYGPFDLSEKYFRIEITSRQICPTCPQPTPWSDCVDGKQTRTNYKCDETTNFECQSYTEERACQTPSAPQSKSSPPYWIILVFIIIGLISALIYFFLKMLKRQSENKWKRLYEKYKK